LVRAALGAGIALLYISVSATMIMFIKFLMHPDRFPYAACLTSVQMLITLTLSSCLRQVSPGLFPAAEAVFAKSPDDSLWPLRCYAPFLPLGLLNAAVIVLSNAAYMYADVCFLQMVKESAVVIVYTFMVLFGLDALRWQNVAVLGFVAASAVVAVRGASIATFTITGLVLQLAAGVTQSLFVVLSNVMMSSTKGRVKIDPMTMVLCTAPMMLLGLLPLTYAFWHPDIPSRMVQWWPYILANCFMAFSLQVVSTMTIKHVSATGHALASVTKDLAIVGSANLVMGEAVSKVQITGFLGSVAGITVYSAMKLFPKRFGF